MCEQTSPAADATGGPGTVKVSVDLPPNHLLVQIPVYLMQESYNWYERLSGIEYAGAGEDYEIVADTLDDKHAALLAFQAENSDAFPDGTSALEHQIAARFKKQRENYAAAGAAKLEKSLSSVFPKSAEPADPADGQP